MSVIRIILTVLFIIDCIGLTIIVLMQEGKSAGLGAISGAAESYWQAAGLGFDGSDESQGGLYCQGSP